MSETERLHQAILDRLSTVIDPETGADVIRMRLVEDVHVGPGGHISYTFRPSSPICPIAAYLAQSIQQAVAEVSGVSGQTIAVDGYIMADELAAMLNDAATDASGEGLPDA